MRHFAKLKQNLIQTCHHHRGGDYYMSWNIFFVVDNHSKLGINNPFLVVEIHSNKMGPHLNQHQPFQSI